MKRLMVVVLLLIGVIGTQFSCYSEDNKLKNKFYIYTRYSEDESNEELKKDIDYLKKKLIKLGIDERGKDQENSEDKEYFVIIPGILRVVVRTVGSKHTEIAYFCDKLRHRGSKYLEEEKKAKEEAKVLAASIVEKPPSLGLVLKISPISPNEKLMQIALSFLNEKQKIPMFTGTRVISDTLPVDGTKTIFGLKGRKKEKYIPVLVGNDKFAYMYTDVDRHENGMFSLSKLATKDDEYRLKGILCAYGEVFIIDRVVKENEEAKVYQKIDIK